MTYRVEFTTKAAKQVKKLPRPIQGRVLDAVSGLAEDPRPQGSRKLVGEEFAWRVRLGDYRVIYEIHDSELVVRAAHRREAYSR